MYTQMRKGTGKVHRYSAAMTSVVTKFQQVRTESAHAALLLWALGTIESGS
jgi:hypothetical protein